MLSIAVAKYWKATSPDDVKNPRLRLSWSWGLTAVDLQQVLGP
jgi:hypothetical protein